MGSRIRTRRAAVATWFAVALLLASSCTDTPRGAGPSPEVSTSMTSAPSAPGSSSATPSTGEQLGEPGATSIRLLAPPGGSFLVRGRFPSVPTSCREPERPRLTGRFPGTLRARRSTDGTIALVVTLPFDRYLEGIAEVPPSWPSAALDAQAIAARSYALATTGWTGEEGDALDQPICATTSCQVYRGIPVPMDPLHRRWVHAVRRTDGQVLLAGGRPATTVYFSTSNGRTDPNEDVFGSSALPYLRGVTERDDGASPTSRWRIRLPLEDLTAFLRAAGRWPAGAPIRRAAVGGETLTVRGGGVTRSVDTGELRDAVNTWAPCLRPHRYPTRVDGDRLPLTIPSRWLRLSAGDGALIVTGRGWGHGVGMVQWGAYGKASRGWSAAEILAFYYGGLRPTAYPEPGVIHVQVATGLTALRIVPSGVGARLDGVPIGTEPIVVTAGEHLEVTG
jgi:stage II sporulation protein D